MTRVQIISNSLTLLGQKPIISLDNQNSITSAAEQAYDFLLPLILSTGQWRFCTKIAQLLQLVEVPPTQTNWSFIYQLPADYLKLYRLYPHNYAYEIYGQRQMYSNVRGPLFLEYQYQPPEGELPYYFCAYLIYRIGEYLAISNAQDVQFSTKLAGDMGIAMSQALAADAMNRPNVPMISQPIISERSVSTLMGFSG